jgi:hypothetical protein
MKLVFGTATDALAANLGDSGAIAAVLRVPRAISHLTRCHARVRVAGADAGLVLARASGFSTS